MGSYDFNGTTNSIGSGSAYLGSLGAAFTLCALGVRDNSAQFMFSISGDSATSTDRFGLGFDNTGQLMATVRTVDYISTIAVPAGVVCIWTASHPNATTAMELTQWRSDTGAFSAQSVGSNQTRTTGAVTLNVGTWRSIDFHDGRLCVVMAVPRVLSQIEIQQLQRGRFAWLDTAHRGAIATNAACLIDLTQPGTVRDLLNPSIAFTGGTQPAFTGDSLRLPGW